jgi:trimeric autotransporter adhesin
VLRLWVGDEIPLRVVGKYSDGAINDLTRSSLTTYLSSAPGVATVTSDGRVRAVAPGTARIRINLGRSIPVTVLPPVAIMPPRATLYAGQTFEFTANVRIRSGQSATWSVSPAGTGTLSTIGPYSAVYTAPASISSPQQVTITATAVADNTKSST